MVDEDEPDGDNVVFLDVAGSFYDGELCDHMISSLYSHCIFQKGWYVGDDYMRYRVSNDIDLDRLSIYILETGYTPECKIAAWNFYQVYKEQYEYYKREVPLDF